MRESLAATVVWHPLWAVMVPSAPEGESLGLRLAEMRHCLSQRLMNLATFGWEAHGESPAALRFLDTHKDAGKPRAFQVPKPVSAQTYPCKPFMGGRLGWGCRGRLARVPPPPANLPLYLPLRHSREGGNPDGGRRRDARDGIRIRIYWVIGFSGFSQLVFGWRALIRIHLGEIPGCGEKRKLGETKSCKS